MKMHNGRVEKSLSLRLIIVLFVGVVSACNGNEFRYDVRINEPSRDGTAVGEGMEVKGTASIPVDEYLWVLAHIDQSRFKDLWWPQGKAELNPKTGKWIQRVSFGVSNDIGSNFVVAAVTVKQEEHEKLEGWVRKANKTRNWGNPVYMPKTTSPPVFRTVKKTSH